MSSRASIACALTALVALLAGCGGGGHARATHATAATSSCMPTVSAALSAATRVATVTSTPADNSYGIRGCRYAAGKRVVATVTVDGNPQAFARYSRAVVETGQVTVWSNHPTPQLLSGIAKGAAWIPGDGLMLSSDGRRLVNVQMHTGRHAERTARTITVATLAALAAGQ